MGKDSLIKSTGKKKTTPKKKAATPKKAAAKKTASTTKKSATKKTVNKAPAQKTMSRKKTKKLNLKELIFKKFEPLPNQPKPAPAAETKTDLPSAPPFISTDDPKEKQRLHSLLMARFSMDDVKAAAVAPSLKSIAPQTMEKKNAPVPEENEPADNAGPSSATPSATPSPSIEPQTSGFDNDGVSDIGSSEPDPVQRVIRYGIIAFVVLILLLIGASYKNASKYYIETKADAIEIWQGRFSPMGKQRIILLHGVAAPQDADAVYTRNHVYPMVFSYYLEKADALLDVQGIPNYEDIKIYLHKAEPFAINAEMQADITSRLNTIDLTTLLYKLDVSMRKGTAESLEQAASLVKKAGTLTTTAAQSQLIAQKAEEINTLQAALKSTEAEKEAEAGVKEEAVAEH
jgi:hypothetical protein